MELSEELPAAEWRYRVPEFRLLREPVDFKELLDDLQTQKCLIWLTEEEMFLTHRDAVWSHVRDFKSWSFSVARNDRDVCQHAFRLYAKTTTIVEDSILFRLRDDYFRRLIFSHNEFPFAQFPFSESFVGTILGSNPSRCHEFREFVFSPEQSAAMVKQATPVQLVLTDCEIIDEGKLFSKSYSERSKMFGSLTLQGALPIRGKHFSSLLLQLGKDLATLDKLKIEGAVVPRLDCALLSRINVRKVILQRCVLEDDGESLINAISCASTTFQTLSIDRIQGGCYHSQLTSLNLVPNNLLLSIGDERCKIKHLRVGYPNFDVPVSLIDALQNNQKLESLCLCNTNIPTNFWIRLLDEISRHQSLSLLELENMWNFDPHKVAFLREMLATNFRVEVLINRELRVKQNWQDQWEKVVVPQLRFNRFRRGVIQLGTAVDGSRKVGLFGAALLRNQSNQKRIGLLMSFHADILVTLFQTPVDV
jgi:hypothetical protein